MVLGSKVKGLTYPKSVYLSTSPYGFFYIEHALAMPFGQGTEGDDRWLAELFGLSWEKKFRPEKLDGEEAWKEYVNRVEEYLKKDVPVQTYYGWVPKAEEEKQGRIVTPSGERAFWWEGLTKRNRPDTHSFVIVGLDKANDQVRLNIPAGGWFGLEKYLTVKLSDLRRRIDPLRQELKYTTIAYVPTGKPQKGEEEIQKQVHNRIIRKIQGDPDAYIGERHPRYKFGIKAFEAFKEDLNPSTFSRILEGRTERQDISPLEILVLMKLSLYQQMFVTSLAAEYLEEVRRVSDWEWMSHLNVQYHQLYISTMKLVSAATSTEDKKQWSNGFKPVLQEMQRNLDATINHMKKYPK
jgi:hypothetical protein